jgi:hypothetical protein
MALNAADSPVVSYKGYNWHELRILNCDYPDCTNEKTLAVPDRDGGFWTSLHLDASGNPVVSYNYGEQLSVLRCGNPSCTAGNTISTPDAAGGPYTSLKLDSAGNPVVSYHAEATQDLKVLHCGNPACTAGNTIASPDTLGNVGQYSSLALDSAGNPVVSYYDQTNGALKLLVCGDPYCGENPGAPTPTPTSTLTATPTRTPSPTPTATRTPIPPPAAPTNLTATALSSTRIDLSWMDNATNESAFGILRRTSADAWTRIAVVGPNMTAYSDTSVVGGTQYFYRVRAGNSGGQSAFSNTASATTP